MSSTDSWSPSSWKSKPIAQDVEYPDAAHLTKVLSKIEKLPPLVTPSEIERLRHQLAMVQRNEAFLLHAGDCAESFDACTHENISNKIGLILSFSLILIWGARRPVVRIGRIAGQYAKPRSSPKETIDGREVLSFRGDNVNGLDPNDRTPNPERLLSAYFHSTTTLNYVRGLLTSGFASLHHPRDWSLSHVRSPSLRHEFEQIVDSLSDALDFSRTIGVESGPAFERGGARGTVGEVDFYTRHVAIFFRSLLPLRLAQLLPRSHEGLMLEYEQALTRLLPVPASASADPKKQKPKAHYNTSAHFLWIGDRTRQLTGAHVEYFRGIRNPIGIKVGPSMQGAELVSLLDVVNPDKEAGRVTLITRYGAGKVQDHLAGHIQAVQKSGHPVIWMCDPMHGNTLTSSTGLKTRTFGTIISELTASLRIHTENNSRLGGVSLEFTGELAEDGFSVTECLGGSMELTEDELGLRYQSFCDPRLNFEQSLDVAFLISNHFKNERKGWNSKENTDVLYTELIKDNAIDPSLQILMLIKPNQPVSLSPPTSRLCRMSSCAPTTDILSNEILSEIFLALRALDPGSVFDNRHGATLAAQVCHRFRTVALATPRLWSKFSLGAHFVHPGHLRVLLARSRAVPVSVRIENASYAHIILTRLLRVGFASRLTELNATWSYALPGHPHCTNDPPEFPALTTLNIVFFSEPDVADFVDSFANSPKLRSVKLRSFGGQELMKRLPNLPWSQLESFESTAAPAPRKLAKRPRLTTLEHLHTLDLRLFARLARQVIDYGLLGALALPALRHLRLEGCLSSWTGVPRDFAGLQERSGFSLRTLCLTLGKFYSATDYAALLEKSPDLEELMLLHGTEGVPRQLIEVLAGESTLMKLAYFTLDARNALEGPTGDNLARMLEMRCRRKEEHGCVSMKATLRLDGWKMPPEAERMVAELVKDRLVRDDLRVTRLQYA
ncbi:Phospho-2-dehydro-3-deoxyheptonate aldolase [Mycena kentingensis (nom. inval.)]|nr:Phospho-2-dehydro-3-deoxyheptonate aldolase [Mycena kentingensis (nom. inval.)]